MITILSSASARPNFVKLAAVHHALKGRKDVRHVIVHTGQHYDPLFSDIFFQQLEIDDPAYNLGVKGGATREATIAATALAFEEPLKQEKPEIVLVYGDVNGAVGAARAAKKLGIKIGHIEAGLRSFDPSMPEELNRIEIDTMADFLFTTEKSAEENIRAEKLKGEVHFVGNTMIDTLVRMQSDLAPSTQEKFCIATIHRPSNVDSEETLQEILGFLSEISLQCPVVLPLHIRTKSAIEKFGFYSLLAKIRVVEPLGYIEFLKLLSTAAFIVTDSGGIQEEATFLKKRCFTMRRNTERPSTIESGSNILIDPSDLADRAKVLEFAKNPQQVEVKIPPLWDGKAGERIANFIASEDVSSSFRLLPL